MVAGLAMLVLALAAMVMVAVAPTRELEEETTEEPAESHDSATPGRQELTEPVT